MNENGAGGSPVGQKNNTLSQRLEIVQKRPENGFCSECQAKKPRWAVLLSHTEDHDGLGIPCHELGVETDTLLGMLVCISCSTVFKSLGARSVVTVKALNHEQTCALENGGNKVINTIFEGNLTVDVERPVPESNSDARQTYIKAKYIDKKWFNISAAKSVLVATGITNKSSLSTKNISLRGSKNDSLSRSAHGSRPSRNSNKNNALSLSLHGTRGGGGGGGSVAGSAASISSKRLAVSPKKLQRRRMLRQNSNHSISGRSSSRHQKHRQKHPDGGGEHGDPGESFDIDFDDSSSSGDDDDNDSASFGGDESDYDDDLARDLKELSRSSHDARGEQQQEPRSSQKSLRSPKRDTNRKSSARTPRHDGTVVSSSTTDEKKMANSFDKLCFGTASDDDGFFPADNSGFGDDVGGFDINDDPFGDSFGGESFGGDDGDDDWWGGGSGSGTLSKAPTNATNGDDEQNGTQPASGVTHQALNDTPASEVKRREPRSKSIGRSTNRRSKSITGSTDMPVPQRRQGDLLGSSRHGSSNDLDISRSSRRSMHGSPRSPRRGFSELDVSRSRRKGNEPPRRTTSSRSLHKLEGDSSPRSPRRTKSSISSVGGVSSTSPRRASSSRSSRQTSMSTSMTRSSSKSRALSEQLSRDSECLDDHIEDDNKSAGGRQQSSGRSRRRMGSSSSIRSAPMLQNEPEHENGPDDRRRRRRKEGLNRSSHHSSGTSLKATSAHSTSISSHDSSVSISISDDSIAEEFEASQIIQVRREDEGEEQPKSTSARRRMRRDELASSSGHQGERSRRSTTSSLSMSRHSSHKTSKISSRSGHRTSRSSSSRSKEVSGSNVTEKTDTTRASSDESPKNIRSPTKNKSITQMALSNLYSE